MSLLRPNSRKAAGSALKTSPIHLIIRFRGVISIVREYSDQTYVASSAFQGL